MKKAVSAEEIVQVLTDLLARIPEVRFAYLFGSQAQGKVGPLSDVDIAVSLEESVSPFKFRLHLIELLTRELGTERIDLVPLNEASPLMKYEVLRTGRVIKEDKEKRVDFETRALAEYLDTAYLRRIQRDYIKEQLTRGGSFGQ